MNIEEQRKIISRQIVWAIVGLVVFELILMGVAWASSVYVLRAGLQIRIEFLVIAIIALGSVGMVPIIILVRRAGQLETLFWQEVAHLHGYTYVHRPYFQERALVFQQGQERGTGHGLMGTVYDRPFRFFQYHYTTGRGKNEQTHHAYNVYEVAFSGTFPHIYLNNTHNRDLSNLKGFFLPRISLPHELEKKFNLHGPKQYEIEVLEIFTPTLLLHLLETDWEHDLELVDQKLYVFREESIRTKQAFEQELERLEKLLALLTPKLNHMRLTPIGDHVATL